MSNQKLHLALRLLKTAVGLPAGPGCSCNPLPAEALTTIQGGSDATSPTVAPSPAAPTAEANHAVPENPGASQ